MYNDRSKSELVRKPSCDDLEMKGQMLFFIQLAHGPDGPFVMKERGGLPGVNGLVSHRSHSCAQDNPRGWSCKSTVQEP